MTDHDEVFKEQLASLAEKVVAVSDSLAAQTVELHKQNVHQTEHVTILRRHLAAQEDINERISTSLGSQDMRLRLLEQHKAVLDATLPKKWLDTDQVEADMKEMTTKINSIDKTIAKWCGIATAAITVLQLVVVPLGKILTAKFFGVTP